MKNSETPLIYTAPESIYSSSLKAVLCEHGIQTRQFSDMDEFKKRLRHFPQSTALFDIYTPGFDIHNLSDILKKSNIKRSIILGPLYNLAQLRLFMRLGFSDLILPTDNIEDLVDSILNTSKGFESPGVRSFIEEQNSASIHTAFKLTNKEQEVLKLYVQGFSWEEIAGRMYLSIKTIDSHIGKIRTKLGRNKLRIVRHAILTGLVRIEDIGSAGEQN